MKIRAAEYMVAAAAASDFPAPGAPEVAFLGRSNVGKSSLLNRLVGRRRLARTSSTPGKTRLLCWYRVQRISGDLWFVDLPGYECQYTEYDSDTGTWTTTPPPGSPAAIEAERQTSSEEEQLDFGYYELPSRNRPKWGSADVGRFGYPFGR